MPQGRHERKFLAGEEIDEGAPAGAHVIDPLPEAELLDGSEGVSSSDHGEAVRFGDSNQKLSRPNRKRLELEDAGGTVEENRLRRANDLDVSRDRVEADVVDRMRRRKGFDVDRPPHALVVQHDIGREQDAPSESLEEVLALGLSRVVVVDLAPHELGRRSSRVDSEDRKSVGSGKSVDLGG